MVTRLIFNGKPANAPNCFEDLTIGQFQSIYDWELDKPVEERNFYKLFTLLNPAYTSVKESPENEVAVWELTRFVVQQPIPYPSGIPKTLKIDGITIEIPDKVGSLSIGQNIVLQQLLEKSKFAEQCYTMALAIYLQPLFDKSKFDMKRVKVLNEVIKTLPAMEVHGLAFFILSRAAKHGWKPLNAWQLTKINLKRRLKEMLRPWPRLTSLPAMLIFLLLFSMLQSSDKIRMKYSGKQVSIHSSTSLFQLKTETNTKSGSQIYGD